MDGVRKSIQLRASGTSIEAAIGEALDRAELTLEGVDSFEVTKITGRRLEIGLEYEVELTVWFTLLDRIHG
ncbi:MAG: dodecin domain-containing protein [Actinomycetales bacterium]